ncbi:hypothetical protein ULMS_22260 [Patiriisocius marinistellae]|uniref:Thioredoxin domain-containing protein n=1 Tax=Patiriisocius marinistellae TaxID=2494560 RepID=A0A5J4FZ85_9FLAO|nr:TlpA disulfide reductase family protein [Patiriisocius marinistellae]GEQ86718.1 hypothetical protein ULMS_22260 [Patiriisocius marinistellae]
MKFFKKHWGNLLFLIVLGLLIIPQTRMPIQVFAQRIISFSPSEISEDERVSVEKYDWELETNNGIIKNLSESKGNVALINLWATWCPPCVAEMPSMQRLYNDYGDRVDFYFISAEKPAKIKKFMKDKGYTFPVFIQTQKAPEVFSSQALPTTYVVSKKGEILIEKVGAASWNSKKVRALLTTEIER